MADLEGMTLTNAAGMVKTADEARALLNSAVTRITLGSYTSCPRSGNVGQPYYYDPERKTAWNSMGLNNKGFYELMTWLPWFYRDEVKPSGKQLAVSIAGFSPREYESMAVDLACHCDIVEVNAGCPNVWVDDQQKPVPSYDPALLHEILLLVGRAVTNACNMSVKLSPIPDSIIPDIIHVLHKHQGLSEVVGTNTLPNQTPENPAMFGWREHEEAKTKYTGGMSGAELRPDSLRVLEQIVDGLPSLPYIFCGGVSSGEHFIEAMELGATGIAIGTAFFEEGPRIFSDVLADAVELSD